MSDPSFMPSSSVHGVPGSSPFLSTPDRGLAIFVIALAVFGLLMLLSASVHESIVNTSSPQSYFLSQAGTLVVALLLTWLISQIPMQLLRKLTLPLSLGCLLCLVLVKFSSLGVAAGGAERWLNLSFLRFQPSEVAKLACIFLLADGLASWGWCSKPVITRLALCVLMGLLIFLQPDLGTLLLFASTCAFMLLIGGGRLQVAALAALLLGAIFYLSLLNNPYQTKRLEGWLHPEQHPTTSGWNLLQSYYAIGLGGWTGSGYGSSIQKLGYLPVSHADFIYAIICEELGILGAITVIGAFLFLLWRGMDISLRSKSKFNKLLGTGIVFSLSAQAIINLGGVVGLLPVTGIPLPFISYGRSSMIVVGIMLGILLNISRGGHSRKGSQAPRTT